MTSISNQTDLENWTGGDIGTLTGNITLVGGSWPKVLPTNTTLDGAEFTITIHSGMTSGLFTVGANGFTGTFKNLIIDADAIATVGEDNSVLMGYHEYDTIDLTIEDCGIVGSYNIGSGSGSFVGKCQGNIPMSLTMTRCFSTGNTTGANGGCLVGRGVGISGVVDISYCYTTGNVTAQGGGGFGGAFFGYQGTSVSLTNCYTTGNVSGTNAGGFFGWNTNNSGTSFTMENCYTSGTIAGTDSGALMGKQTTGTGMTIRYCYCQYALATGAEADGFVSPTSIVGSPTMSDNRAGGGGAWDSVINSDLQDSYGGDSNVWDTTFSDGFGLVKFTESPWNSDAYTMNTSVAAFGTPAGGGGGDPHIRTMNGEVYDAITDKFFRLFDNNNKESRLIINAQVDQSTHPIWSDKEYMTKIFISHGSNKCIIDPGFRGSRAVVLYNNGFVISDEDQVMSSNAKQFCSKCTYRGRDIKLLQRHRRNNRHPILPNIRNKLKLTIDTQDNIYDIEISNVNVDNFMPSQIRVMPQKSSMSNTYSGALSKISEPYSHDIDNLLHVGEYSLDYQNKLKDSLSPEIKLDDDFSHLTISSKISVM